MTDASAGLRSYRPGEWYAVLGDRVVVLVPPSERPRVAALWELVEAGADADEVLDALIAGGLRSLPGFVLLAETGDRLRVVLRGAARAGIDTFDGPVALDGADATTWVERVLPGVTAVRVDVADHADGADREIETGLVRVGRLDQPPNAEAAPPAPIPLPTPEPTPESTPPPEPVPTPERSVAVGSPLDADPSDDLGDEPTEAIDLGGLPDLPVPVPPLGPPPSVPPPPPLPPPPPAEPPGMTFGWRDIDHDGTTRTPGPADAPEHDEDVADVTAQPVARLTFTGGEVVDVDRVVLVGRAPAAHRYTDGGEPRLVTVTSPHQEISSTHVEVRPGSGADHGSAVVTDLGSTNGTVLAQPGLAPEVLQPGVAVQLLPGAVIDLGDGVSIRVSHP